LEDNCQIEIASNADFTAATAASRFVVFANEMTQVFLLFAGLNNENVLVDLGLTQELLM
jgi:hypothetical protein